MLRFQCQVVLASSRGQTFSLRRHLGFFRPASVGGPRPRGKLSPTLRSVSFRYESARPMGRRSPTLRLEFLVLEGSTLFQTCVADPWHTAPPLAISETVHILEPCGASVAPCRTMSSLWSSFGSSVEVRSSSPIIFELPQLTVMASVGGGPRWKQEMLLKRPETVISHTEGFFQARPRGPGSVGGTTLGAGNAHRTS